MSKSLFQFASFIDYIKYLCFINISKRYIFLRNLNKKILILLFLVRNMTEEPRKIFIYLAVIAVVLGFVGVIKLRNDFTGKIVERQEEKEELIEYSLNEFSGHNSEQDCWLALENKVYDITLFLQIYESKLKEECGEFVDINSLSSATRKELEIYSIGKLK